MFWIAKLEEARGVSAVYTPVQTTTEETGDMRSSHRGTWPFWVAPRWKRFDCAGSITEIGHFGGDVGQVDDFKVEALPVLLRVTWVTEELYMTLKGEGEGQACKSYTRCSTAGEATFQSQPKLTSCDC